MCLLSIITINLNNCIGLEKTIKSVLSQSFRDYEFIIIDGKSEDASMEIIKKYSDKINYWVSEEDSGIYNAMNKGIRNSTAEYCLFLNSGDLLLNENVLSHVSSLGFSEDVILFRSVPFSNNNLRKTFENNISSSEITFNDLFVTSFNHQATLIKRDLFSRYGLYDERYRIISDHIFIIRSLGLNNSSFKFIDFEITNYDIDGISQDVKDFYESEIVPAYNEVIPHRIYQDYNTGYLDVVKRLKKNPLYWLIFRVLCKLVRLHKA